MRLKSTSDKLQYDNTSGTWGRDHYWALKKKLYKCLSTVSFTVSCYSLQLVAHWQLQCLTFTIWWWVHTDQFICLNMPKSPSCSSGITLDHMQINSYSICGTDNKILTQFTVIFCAAVGLVSASVRRMVNWSQNSLLYPARCYTQRL